ncbi:MAG: GAF domain-containing protein, partial [Geothrix sp.]|nr:GAF domain-containing protein [Geothrix sp.]
GALERLRPGLSPRELGEALMEVCFKPLGLACFFVALADWEQDQLVFVLYHEGGRTRQHPSRRLSDRAGLSERVLSSHRPLYIRTLEEGQTAGSLLTAAELATGLIPHSWYGVPLGWGSRPAGLVSFQSFQTDAFSDSRRRVMDALAVLMSNCLGQCP